MSDAKDLSEEENSSHLVFTSTDTSTATIVFTEGLYQTVSDMDNTNNQKNLAMPLML